MVSFGKFLYILLLPNLYIKYETKKAKEQGITNNVYKLEEKNKDDFLEKCAKTSYEDSGQYFVVNGNCLIIKDKE